MDRTSRVAMLLSVLAMAVAGFVWFTSNQQIEMLRASQRDLMTEVSAMRRTPLIDITGAPTLGAPDAVVTLIEFSDYECPFCIRHFEQTWPQINENFVKTGKIRYVFRDFPVDQLHPDAIRAHEAAQCAAEQDRFWEMHQLMFSAPGTHTPAALEERAGEAGLKLDTYRACLESGRTTEPIRASAALAAELGASGTPAFFVGILDPATGQVRVLQAITGAQSFATFAKTIDAVAQKQ